MEMTVVRAVSRFKFISFIKYYKDGSYINNPKLTDVIAYRRAQKVVIEAENRLRFALTAKTICGSGWKSKFSISNYRLFCCGFNSKRVNSLSFLFSVCQNHKIGP